MKKNKSNILNIVSCGAVMALCLSAFGIQVACAKEAGFRGQLSAKDYKFVTETLQCGTMEVNLGQLAVQKGADQAIRDFGQRMIEDHRKANQELSEIINLKGASIPEPSNKKGERMAEHLLSLSGTAFDKAYIKHMVRDHKKAVKEFEMETESAGDAELKNWAAGTLPTLKTHLHMAENTEASIGSVKSLSMAR